MLVILGACCPLALHQVQGSEWVPQPAADKAFEGEYLVNFWRGPDGLPNETVNALLQSRDGYLWVGTAAGLARFDGLKFTVLGSEVSPMLENTSITALLEDNEGALWVGTQQKGLFRLVRGKCEWFSVARGLAGSSVTSIALTTSGEVWVGTTEGLNCWKNGEMTRFLASAVPQSEHIVALNAGGSGALWITTRSGVFCLRDGKAVAFKSGQLPQGRNAEFIGAYEDRSGNLWAFGATFLLNVSQGQSLNNFASFNLASSRVWTICEQSDADFWIGTSGQGLFRFQNGRFDAVGIREGLEHCDIRALHADRWGNLWIGTGGNGLVRLRTRRVKVVGMNAGVYSRNLSAIAPDGVGGLWIGTEDSGLWHWNGRQAEAWTGGGPLGRVTQIQALCLDAGTNLWVGTAGSGIIKVSGNRQLRLTTADGLAEDGVLAMAYDADTDTVWAGTPSGFLHRIRNDRVQTFSPLGRPSAVLCLLPGPGDTLLAGLEDGTLARWDGAKISRAPAPAGLSGVPIRSLFEDVAGRLWVGTWGAGVFCRNTSNSWVSITKKEGLDSDNVGLIAQSGEGTYWFGTGENLLRARVSEIESFLLGLQESVALAPALSVVDGLKCARGWPNTAYSPAGSPWLACASEVLPLNETENPGAEPPPPVILEHILVNGHPHPIPEDGVLTLGPGARSLDFEFTAITFTAPQRVRFQHKLENFDADWVQNGTARRAHYGPLPPGDYRFKVIAANAENRWNEAGATLRLVVKPPLWRAWWFLGLAGAGSVAGISATARYISTRRLAAKLRLAEQQHAMERERARIARDMHDEIGSKLTRISFLSEVARRTTVDQSSSQPVKAIADTTRELLLSLDEIVWAVNPRNDNLEQLAGYLEQHAREYFQGTRCECKISVPAQLPEVVLSAELRHNIFLAFEEALNNSLKHAEAMNVEVTMRVAPEYFEIRVRDDGRGFNPTCERQPENDGLRNMTERLEAVGGTCDIRSQPGAGAVITFRFPLTKASGNGTLLAPDQPARI